MISISIMSVKKTVTMACLVVNHRHSKSLSQLCPSNYDEEESQDIFNSEIMHAGKSCCYADHVSLEISFCQ